MKRLVVEPILNRNMFNGRILLRAWWTVGCCLALVQHRYTQEANGNLHPLKVLPAFPQLTGKVPNLLVQHIEVT